MDPSSDTPPQPVISLATTVLHALRSNSPKSISQVEVETGRELTFAHLTKLSLSVVQGLIKNGVTHDSLILLVSFNSQEAHILFLATILLGATVSVLDPSLTPEEMCHLIDIVKPEIIYSEGGKTLKKVEAAISIMDMDPLIIVSGKFQHVYFPFKNLLQPTDPEFQPKAINPARHNCMVLFTSGTSGLPKGVCIPDIYFLLFFKAAQKLMVPDKRSNEDTLQSTELTTSPLFWISGVIQLLVCILTGSKRIFFRGVAKEEVILSTIQNFKVNTWTTSPTVLMKLTTYKKRQRYNLNSLRAVAVGGAALNAESQLMILRDLLKNKCLILQNYGMTEIGVVLSSLLGIKPGSCGKLLPGIQAKIVDLESGETLEPNEKGEVCFKGQYFMLGYFNNPEATQEVYDEEGWFHTGDIGYIDEDGFFFIIDRLKELIKYRVYQIAPAEVESILFSHPAVKDCAVVGIPDPVDGEHPAAFVVKQEQVSEAQLLEYVSQRVSEYKHLRGGIIFIDSIPYTTSGKKKRRLLKTQLLIGLNALV